MNPNKIPSRHVSRMNRAERRQRAELREEGVFVQPRRHTVRQARETVALANGQRPA